MAKNNPTWISESFIVNKNHEFEIGGVLLSKITEKVNPPFYVYDWETIRRQFESLNKNLSRHNIGVYYSIKANTSLAIVNRLYKLGSRLEVASIGELTVAKYLGIDFGKISFAGPVKTEEELIFAIKNRIGTINVESLEEFEKINRIAGSLKKKQAVGIRINPKHQVAGAKGFMGGGSKKFGFDDEKVDEKFLHKILSLPNVRLEGLHVFSATQMLDPKAFLANIEAILKIASRLNKYFDIKYVDFGGGLGIPYSEKEKPLDIKQISSKIGKLIGKFEFVKKNKTKFYIEPGRFMVGLSGIYIVRVDNVKVSRGKRIALVDGGIQHMIRPLLNNSEHPIYNLSCLNSKSSARADVGGSLCTSLDFLGQNIELPLETKAGDLLGVFCAGAYGFSESMPLFLSHPFPAEVLVYDKKFKVVRPSFQPMEFIKRQILV